MKAGAKNSGNPRHKALMKAGILVAFIILSISLIRYTPIKNYLTVETMGHFLERDRIIDFFGKRLPKYSEIA